MKVRVKFTKGGYLKFIGHLDMMRYFQKAIRRAKIKIRYTEGFSPHQVMSFAAPLGLGDISECEYMDIDVLESGSSQEMVDRLNAVMVEGIEVKSWRLLPEKAKNAMAAMAAADYELSFREGYEPEDWDGFVNGLSEYVGQEQILIQKKTKKSIKEVDIKPLIYQFEIRDHRVFLQVSAGSLNNLKPELVVESYLATLGKELPVAAIQVLRKELYTDLGTEDEHRFVTLEDIGSPMEEGALS